MAAFCELPFVQMWSHWQQIPAETRHKNFRMRHCCIGQFVPRVRLPQNAASASPSVQKLLSQTTVTLLKAHFVGCLRTRITSTLSPKDSTSRKRSASDSPLTSSTPWSCPPAQKRPVVVHTDSLVPGTRRSLAFNTEPEADTNSGNSEQLQPSLNQ